MRPPILFLTIGFGAGLCAGLDLFAVRGALYAVAPVLVAALWLARRAPLGAAAGIMGVAGALWGTAAGRERGATCAGTRSEEHTSELPSQSKLVCRLLLEKKKKNNAPTLRA